jgi:hypothetical protein
MKVIWPDDQMDLQYLTGWTTALVQRLASGNFVTIAIASKWRHSVGEFEPLCLQISEIFSETYNPFDATCSCPALGPCDGVMVFCTGKTGRRMPDELSQRLSPLLEHERIVMVTFDFTNVAILLGMIGITPRLDRCLDAELLNVVSETNLLTPVQPKSLTMAINQIPVCVPVIERAQSFVAPEKAFPWDATAFVIEVEKLPITAIVSQKFLEYAAGEVVLIGLAVGEVARRGELQNVARTTQIKRMEYQAAVDTHERLGPWLVRQAAAKRIDLPSILGGGVQGSDTLRILHRWHDLTIARILQEHNETAWIAIPQTITAIDNMIRDHKNALMTVDHWEVVAEQALTVDPPGFTRTPFVPDLA